MYHVFTRMPVEIYRRRLGSLLLYLCYVFRSLNYLPLHERSGPRTVSDKGKTDKNQWNGVGCVARYALIAK